MDDIMSGDPYLQGTVNPTFFNFLEGIQPENNQLSFENLCVDILDYEEEMKANNPPQEDYKQIFADHNYGVMVPDSSNEVTFHEGTVIDTLDVFPYQSFDLVQEYTVSSSNQVEVMQVVPIASESDFSRSSSMSPCFTDCDKVGFELIRSTLHTHAYASTQSSSCSEILSLSGTKRGRPRKNPEDHLKTLEKITDKNEASIVRNKASSIKYRHKKADEHLEALEQLTKLESKNNKLAQKSQKLAHNINMLKLMLSSL